MKFLVPNYSCLQNPWLGGYCPQIPVLSVLNWICWTSPPPKKKIPGYATANTHCIGGWVGLRASLGVVENLAFTGIPSLDRPARSKLLYQLCYTSPLLWNVLLIKCHLGHQIKEDESGRACAMHWDEKWIQGLGRQIQRKESTWKI